MSDFAITAGLPVLPRFQKGFAVGHQFQRSFAGLLKSVLSLFSQPLAGIQFDNGQSHYQITAPRIEPGFLAFSHA